MFCVAVSIGAPGAATIADAQGNPSAGGAYTFTITRTCTSSNLPFAGPNFSIPLSPAPPGPAVLFRTVWGVITYDGDGSRTLTDRSSATKITAVPRVGPRAVGALAGTFTYAV
jgi:hypothetical protein